MFEVARHTIATAVAASGTFDVAYPSGTNAGTFRGAVGHKIVTGKNDVFASPANFTVSFGTSAVTVTSVDMALAVGTELFCQFEKMGNDKGDRPDVRRTLGRMTYQHPVRVNLGAPDTADADGVAASQTVTVATTPLAVIDGALASGGVATFDVPRNVVAAWTGTAVLTVTGTDEFGDIVVEASASGTSLTGKKAFKTVTAASFSANVSSATIGTGDVLGLPVFVPEKAAVLHEFQDGALLGSNKDKVYVSAKFADIGTADSIWLPSPVAGKITKITTIIDGAITSADCVVTTEINGTLVTGSSITIANSGSAAGDVDTATPTAANTVAVGDKIEFITDGAGTGTTMAWVLCEITPTHTLNGTLVAGSDSAPTATTGDVRGTYDPTAACNGSLVFELDLLVPDEDYLGLDNFDG